MATTANVNGNVDPVTGLYWTLDRLTSPDGKVRYELLILDDSEGFTDGIPSNQVEAVITEPINLEDCTINATE